MGGHLVNTFDIVLKLLQHVSSRLVTHLSETSIDAVNPCAAPNTLIGCSYVHFWQLK